MKQGPISLERALSILLAQLAPLEPEQLSLPGVLGRVLAEDVSADHDLPSFANAAMDGYAVRGADITAARSDAPVGLQVLGEVAAGQGQAPPVRPGTAVRIMTGAPLPPGADTVVPWEQTDQGRSEPGRVYVRQALPAGRHVRQAGEDVRRGELLLCAGQRLRAPEIGLLAALGRSRVRVTRRPRLAVLAGGDELVEPGRPLGPGQIYSSNAYALSAYVQRYGGEALRLPPTRDTLESLAAGLEQAREAGADLAISSGGTAQGAYDWVHELLRRRGRLYFHNLRLRPGRLTTFGRWGGLPLLALPGNPASALVAFELLGRPALLHLQGQRALRKPEVTALLQEDVGAHQHAPRYLRALVQQDETGGFSARLTGPQGTAMLSSMARANALLVIPETAYPRVPAGSSVRALMLDWPEVE
ncbi:MAG: molybdopterin molybdotransferase MoeA [Chloroflexia bacterium]|nr:molybdopterin molybdotransferase MoeA [Chloroflexia bacterium]